ncbi:MAG: nucleotidyltransferase family protein, partial [Acidobacteriaceae bacterium]|nr:nucleotidyltransferase family protein [Acidobacteriaceae bacterium]
MKTHPHFRPEHELLILCAEAVSSNTSNHRIPELLASGISWSNLLLLADRNEILPLVYSCLSSFTEQIPSGALAILKKRSASIASWNLALASELLTVSTHLKRNGVRATAFKGPALAMALYGHLGLRHCRDLDLLIDAGQVWDAVRILEAEAYLLAGQFPLRPEREWLKVYKDVALRNPATGVHVELHWAVCEPAFDARVHAADLWQQTETVTVLGAPVSFPSPSTLLFLLAIHGMRHYWNSLKWITDIDRCVRAYPALDWQSATEVADSLARRRTLLLPLKLCQDLLRTPLPAGISSRVEGEAGVCWLVDQISDDLFKKSQRFSISDAFLLQSRSAAESDISRKLVRARAKDSIDDRLRYVLLLIRQFLQPDAIDTQSTRTWRKPNWLFWIVQPLRLMRAHGVRFFFRTSK